MLIADLWATADAIGVLTVQMYHTTVSRVTRGNPNQDRIQLNGDGTLFVEPVHQAAVRKRNGQELR